VPCKLNASSGGIPVGSSLAGSKICLNTGMLQFEIGFSALPSVPFAARLFFAGNCARFQRKLF
jgi:hypothetical protein